MGKRCDKEATSHQNDRIAKNIDSFFARLSSQLESRLSKISKILEISLAKSRLKRIKSELNGPNNSDRLARYLDFIKPDPTPEVLQVDLNQHSDAESTKKLNENGCSSSFIQPDPEKNENDAIEIVEVQNQLLLFRH